MLNIVTRVVIQISIAIYPYRLILAVFVKFINIIYVRIEIDT